MSLFISLASMRLLCVCCQRFKDSFLIRFFFNTFTEVNYTKCVVVYMHMYCRLLKEVITLNNKNKSY